MKVTCFKPKQLHQLFARLTLCTFLAMLGTGSSPMMAAEIQNLDRSNLRNCGSNLALAIEQAETDWRLSEHTAGAAQAAEKLGLLYWQAGQSVPAKLHLEQAYRLSQDSLIKPRLALMLGNINASQNLIKPALQWWHIAQEASSNSTLWSASLELNRLRLYQKSSQSKSAALLSRSQFLTLQQTITELSLATATSTEGIKLGLNLFELALASYQSQIARRSEMPAPAELQAWAEFLLVQTAKNSLPEPQLQALRLSARLAQDQQESASAFALLARAAALAASQPGQEYQQLLIERQRAALYQQQQQSKSALASYQRAISYLEQIRADLPLQDEYGQSLHRSLVQPVYQAYADLLLQQARQEGAAQASQTLYQVRALMEASKRSELQDYLGERCSVEQVQQNQLPQKIADGVAVIYPIVFADRTEILLETAAGMQIFTVNLNAASLQQHSQAWVAGLRSGEPTAQAQSQSEQLWQWLIAPWHSHLQQQGIKQLLIVPDGVLRLLPFAALSDGKNYLVQSYQISTSPALNLIQNPQTLKPRAENELNLLAGMSVPGNVVDKLPENLVQQLLLSTSSRGGARGAKLQAGLRGFNARQTQTEAELLSGRRSQPTQQGQLQEALALDGVAEEIRQLQQILTTQHTTLLDQQFTAAAFAAQLRQRTYSTIHIASHGVFGGDAEHTFIMAYDDLINLQQLQRILKARQGRTQLDLLTLSACETAEGDERAPLGLSGAALQANARSALGSLWSVSDQATSQLMQEFYRARLQGKNKAEALRQAQLGLLQQAEFSQPFYWAAFILVGSYL